MNANIDEYINIYSELLKEINDPDMIFRNSKVSVPLMAGFIFQELTNEIYEYLLGDPKIARIKLAPAKEKIEFLSVQCSLLMARYSDDPMFDSLGLEKDIDPERCELVIAVMDRLSRISELFTDIKAIPDFKG